MNISVIIFSQIVNHKADTCKQKPQKNTPEFHQNTGIDFCQYLDDTDIIITKNGLSMSLIFN